MTDRLTTHRARPTRSKLVQAVDNHRWAEEQLQAWTNTRNAAMREAGAGDMPVTELARLTGLSRVTCYKILKEEKDPSPA